jgi:hypothetical protein
MKSAKRSLVLNCRLWNHPRLLLRLDWKARVAPINGSADARRTELGFCRELSCLDGSFTLVNVDEA